MPESESRRILLNLGCGPNAVPTRWIDCDGSWNVLLGKLPPAPSRWVRSFLQSMGIDILRWPAHVRYLNLRKELPFDSSSVDAVYASHVWEHLAVPDAERATRECYRVLKPGGVLRLVVPDVAMMCTTYLQSRSESAMDRFMEDLHLRSRDEGRSIARRLYYSITDFHSHKWMYDVPSLSALLVRSGFVSVGAKDYNASRIPEIAEVERAERIISGAGIVVEGVKPGK